MNDEKGPQPLQSYLMLGAAGQVGCGTVLLIVLALVVGRWLDSLFGTEPVLLLVFVLTSIPLSLVLMVRSVLGAARASQRLGDQGPTPEDYSFNRHEGDNG
jgi:F0F1-type ATP synthase assembly protein I